MRLATDVKPYADDIPIGESLYKTKEDTLVGVLFCLKGGNYLLSRESSTIGWLNKTCKAALAFSPFPTLSSRLATEVKPYADDIPIGELLYKTKKDTLVGVLFCLKGGNYLLSRESSTIGVRELNFCVRYGNRWILSAIVTAIVY